MRSPQQRRIQNRILKIGEGYKFEKSDRFKYRFALSLRLLHKYHSNHFLRSVRFEIAKLIQDASCGNFIELLINVNDFMLES